MSEVESIGEFTGFGGFDGQGLWHKVRLNDKAKMASAGEKICLMPSPDAYAVINSNGEIEYSVTISKEAISESTDWAKDLCHQHINEVAGLGSEPNVGKWVVRPVFIGAGPTTGERE